ncbi:hypothetical protein EJ06DRAFT_331082 [Trichodelitschia bisporula]|uniref:Uncharacterized protein n=1 Tax=Trichodelitschia bisporula TaxID=703511 RepID=A0A6G1I297_9PEZI|nr:hypothetical protein EJ06DRAFT_331082 [Trichodelitschia bisporula]
MAGMNGQTEDVLCELERLFGMDGTGWTSKSQRNTMVWSGAVLELQKKLVEVGFKNLDWFRAQDGKERLRAMPPLGEPVPEMPEWLRLEYVVPEAVPDLSKMPGGYQEEDQEEDEWETSEEDGEGEKAKDDKEKKSTTDWKKICSDYGKQETNDNEGKAINGDEEKAINGDEEKEAKHDEEKETKHDEEGEAKQDGEEPVPKSAVDGKGTSV